MTWKATPVMLKDIGGGEFCVYDRHGTTTIRKSTGKRLLGTDDIVVEEIDGLVALSPSLCVLRKRDWELQRWCEKNGVDVGSKLRRRSNGATLHVKELSDKGLMVSMANGWTLFITDLDSLEPIKAHKPYTPDEMRDLVGAAICDPVGGRFLVTGFSGVEVCLCNSWIDADTLLSKFIHLDGSPCGTLS